MKSPVAAAPSPLRILAVHESYAIPGGEDRVVEMETAVLAKKGHGVFRWSVDNSQIESWPLSRKARLFWQTTWSRRSYRQLKDLVARHNPDVVHFHNTLPIISPSAIHAARDCGVAVVMTLHNYRFICPVASMLRNGRICEDCSTHSLLRSVAYACYRRSRIQTAAVALMLATHRHMGTWTRCVDSYIVLTNLMRSKLISGGLPENRVHIKPNFVDDPSSAQETAPGGYALFLGRLSAEKGVEALLRAVPYLNGIPVKIVGTGPLDELARAAQRELGTRIELLGQRPHDEAMEILRRARLLIFPSIWYEGLPMTVIEAMARGVPVVATRLGAMAEMITHGREGLLFEPGDTADLSRCVRTVAGDDELRLRMSQAARSSYAKHYSVERGLSRLMEIYETALTSARARTQDIQC